MFVAVTGDDEDNLVASLLAKQEFGVPRVLARVNHPANEWLFTSDWGIDHAVSAPHLLSGLVQEAVTVGSVVRLLDLAENARLVEVTLTEDAPVVGSQIAQINFPREASVVAILRSRAVVVPRGDTSFLARRRGARARHRRVRAGGPSAPGHAVEQRVGRIPDHQPALLDPADAFDHDRPPGLDPADPVAAGEHEHRRTRAVVDLDAQESTGVGRRSVLAANLAADADRHALRALRRSA